jgi:hypothetical protein
VDVGVHVHFKKSFPWALGNIRGQKNHANVVVRPTEDSRERGVYESKSTWQEKYFGFLNFLKGVKRLAV